jgi:hypothetical protein
MHTYKKKLKAKWIGHILRRYCPLKHITGGKSEGRIKVTVRRGRKRKQLLEDLKERTGYGKLKGETLDRTLWRMALEEAMGL